MFLRNDSTFELVAPGSRNLLESELGSKALETALNRQEELLPVNAIARHRAALSGDVAVDVLPVPFLGVADVGDRDVVALAPEEQKDGLAARLDRERIAQGSEADLSELSLQVLRALRAKERLAIAQLASITGANRNTLKVRLRELVADGRGRQPGRARATWCSL